MAPKKAAKKKAAKKNAGKKASRKVLKSGRKLASLKKPAKTKGAKRRNDGKDVRRAYEHLQRLSFLHDRLDPEATGQVDELSRAAQAAMGEEDAATAADLLRAAEHLAFASMAPGASDKNPSEMLVQAAKAQYDTLVGRASDGWEQHDETREAELAALFHHMLGAAETAYAAGALYRALEFARGAEALADAHPGKAGKSRNLSKRGAGKSAKKRTKKLLA